MRTFVGMFLMLSLCIYTVPMEEWDALSKQEKKERLKQGIEVIKQELGCKNPSIQLDIDQQYLYLYGECDNGKFIAINKGEGRQL